MPLPVSPHMITTGFNKIASMIGCSSETMGRRILASSTSEGRVTDTDLGFVMVAEFSFGVFICWAKEVSGSARSSPKGPRISDGAEFLSNFLFLFGGGLGSTGAGDVFG